MQIANIRPTFTAQFSLLYYSQAIILVSVTHVAHITSHIQIHTLLSTFICSHPSTTFVHDKDTRSLLVSNAARITIYAEVTFFAITRYQLFYSDIGRSFVSIPIQSNPMIEQCNSQINLKIVATNIFACIFFPFVSRNSKIDTVKYNSKAYMHNTINDPTEYADTNK